MSQLCSRSWSWCRIFGKFVSQPCETNKLSWPPSNLRAYDSCSKCRASFQCRWCEYHPCRKVSRVDHYKMDYPTV